MLCSNRYSRCLTVAHGSNLWVFSSWLVGSDETGFKPVQARGSHLLQRPEWGSTFHTAVGPKHTLVCFDVHQIVHQIELMVVLYQTQRTDYTPGEYLIMVQVIQPIWSQWAGLWNNCKLTFVNSKSLALFLQWAMLHPSAYMCSLHNHWSQGIYLRWLHIHSQRGQWNFTLINNWLIFIQLSWSILTSDHLNQLTTKLKWSYEESKHPALKM